MGVGLPEKEELRPGLCCLSHPAAQLQTLGLPCRASHDPPAYSGMEAQGAFSSGGSSHDPLRKDAGMLGA